MKNKDILDNKSNNTRISQNTGNAKSLANLKPFQKGISGNPAGRPKSLEVLKNAVDSNINELTKVLVDIALNEKAQRKDRIAAIKELFDRRFGKPVQPIGGEDGQPIQLTLEGILNVMEKYK